MKKILSVSAQAFFYIFSTCFLFVLVFSILSFLEKSMNLDMPFVTLLESNDDFDAQIDIPFLRATFKYSFSYSIVYMWILLFFYSVFFYTLKEFFKIFTKKNIFNTESLQKLTLFFRLNFIPIITNIVVALYEYFRDKNVNLEEEFFMIFVHSCFGIITYLYIDVFTKGNQLQEENDLTI